MHIRNGKVDEMYLKSWLALTPVQRLEEVFRLRRIGETYKKARAYEERIAQSPDSGTRSF